MMQDNNNFETTLTTWRRRSEEQTDSVTVSMSGDSPEYQFKKKDEETNLLVPEKIKGTITPAASAGAVATFVDVPSDSTPTDPETKHLVNNKEDSKEAAGDANNIDDVDYLENKEKENKVPTNKQENSCDKVDSVYLSPSSDIKPPPPQSTASNPDDDECIIKCLYYTLQCCDCVLM